MVTRLHFLELVKTTTHWGLPLRWDYLNCYEHQIT